MNIKCSCKSNIAYKQTSVLKVWLMNINKTNRRYRKASKTSALSI